MKCSTIFFSEKWVLTVGYVKPLLGLPICNIHVPELVFHIRFPSNIRIIDSDVAWDCHCLFTIELEGIIEETFGNETTWESWLTWDELFPSITATCSLDWISELQLFICDDGVAICKWWITDRQVFTEKLCIWARFDVTSVVLVEVLELVVNEDWCFDLGVDRKSHNTFVLVFILFTSCELRFPAASVIDSEVILNYWILNFVAHNVQDYAKWEEDYPKDCKDYHCWAERGHWSPCREQLLFEFALLQLINFSLDSFYFVLLKLHFFFLLLILNIIHLISA